MSFAQLPCPVFHRTQKNDISAHIHVVQRPCISALLINGLYNQTRGERNCCDMQTLYCIASRSQEIRLTGFINEIRHLTRRWRISICQSTGRSINIQHRESKLMIISIDVASVNIRQMKSHPCFPRAMLWRRRHVINVRLRMLRIHTQLSIKDVRWIVLIY